jgi:hypothetical protein
MPFFILLHLKMVSEDIDFENKNIKTSLQMGT